MPFFEHRFVAERKVRRLVPFHALAMSDPLVEILLHTVFHLHLVDGLGNLLAADSRFGHLDLHPGAFRHDFPHLLPALGPRINLPRRVELPTVAADATPQRDLNGVSLLELVVMELVGVRVGTTGAGSTTNAYVDPDRRVRMTIALDVLHDQIGAVLHGRRLDFEIRRIRAAVEDVVPPVSHDPAEVVHGPLDQSDLLRRLDHPHLHADVVDFFEGSLGQNLRHALERLSRRLMIEGYLLVPVTHLLDTL